MHNMTIYKKQYFSVNSKQLPIYFILNNQSFKYPFILTHIYTTLSKNKTSNSILLFSYPFLFCYKLKTSVYRIDKEVQKLKSIYLQPVRLFLLSPQLPSPSRGWVQIHTVREN